MTKKRIIFGKSFIVSLAVLIHLFTVLPLAAQQGLTISGTVYNGGTGEVVDFGTVVVFEARQKVYLNEDGTYSVSVPRGGVYTVQITADGLEPYSEKITVNRSITKDVTLSPLRVQGAGITITGERKQKLSRRSLTVEELEEVPASFGDSISALTSLPGVIRASGDQSFFGGPLVIRSVYPTAHRYYVDGVPIQYPQHFGGLHSVVANEMMASVDLYSSAYPASFKGDLGAVIEINTLDDVEKLSGMFDIGLISATGLVKTPTYRNDFSSGLPEKKKDGYFIASGRVGYLSLVIPLIYEVATDEPLDSVPNYWDYQLKYKKYIDDHNSITLLMIGARDWWDFDMPKAAEEEDTLDPLLQDLEFDTNQMFHNQALYYTYQQGKITNTVLGYATLPYYFNYLNLNHPLASSAFKDLETTSMPFEFALRDTLSFEWWRNRAELNMSLEYTQYRFSIKGEEIVLNELPQEDYFNIFGDQDLLSKKKIDDSYTNHTIGGHIDNRFTLGGLTFVPQLRADYLHRTGVTEVDPRALISYEFETGTTVSAASGKYHAFNQINPYSFQMVPTRASDGKEIEPEHAIHNSLGVEQKFGLFTLSTEGFYNYYYDLLLDNPHTENGKVVWGDNQGEMKNYGSEIMLSKDRRQGTNDFFGWTSYTFSQSKYKTNYTDAEDSSGNGSKWNTGSFEQVHSMKTVIGYYLNKHIFTAKFSYYTALPYTPVVGSWEDEAYFAYTSEQGDPQRRYLPVYSDDVNSKRFPATHQLDLRYSYTTDYKWGNIKWYVEALNVTGIWYNPYIAEEWNYREPYSDSNPEKVRNDGLRVIPNFGVEVRF